MKATVSALYLYPVKGCRGVSLSSAFVASTGLMIDPDSAATNDREWVVVDHNGEFLSQRDYPRMALIATHLSSFSLQLKAPGMLPLEIPFESEGDVLEVRIWNDTLTAVTQGEIADTWFSKFLEV